MAPRALRPPERCLFGADTAGAGGEGSAQAATLRLFIDGTTGRTSRATHGFAWYRSAVKPATAARGVSFWLQPGRSAPDASLPATNTVTQTMAVPSSR